MEAEEEFRSGISRASFTAVLYAIFVFTPALMYLQLMTGLSGIPVAWFTLVLWIELGKISGVRITKQEAFMIFILSGAEMFIPMSFVYRAYFRQSGMVEFFGLTEQIPNWWAPPPEMGIFDMRTFLHPSWIIPIVVALGGILVLRLSGFVLGLMGQEVFIEVEKLPFPVQQVSAKAVITLTGGEERVSNLLFLTALFGFFYGFILYAFPFIWQVWTGQEARIIPIPWVDLTHDIELLGLGGAIFGVATDILPIAIAFILPLSTVICIFIGSFAVYFIGNWLTVQYNLSPISWWVPGMNIQLALQRSILYFWASPIIGITLAAGIVPLLCRPKVLTEAFTHMLHPTKSGKRLTESFPLLRTFLLPYTICAVVGILFFAWLTPFFFKDFFFIVIPLLVGMPIIFTLIQGRMLGETGLMGSPPGAAVPTGLPTGTGTLTNVIYLSTGYPNADLWFVPNMWNASGGGFLAQFKVAQLTKTSVWSFIKAYWILLPVAIAAGFAYMEAFWRIAPIPSGMYPGAAIFWPINATYQCLWMKGMLYRLFRPTWVLGAFAAGAAIYLVGAFTFVPASLVALAVGVNTVTPFAVTYLIGAIIAVILRAIVGKPWWDENKQVISAGLMMGEGIAVTLSVAAALLINSIWFRPI